MSSKYVGALLAPLLLTARPWRCAGRGPRSPPQACRWPVVAVFSLVNYPMFSHLARSVPVSASSCTMSPPDTRSSSRRSNGLRVPPALQPAAGPDTAGCSPRARRLVAHLLGWRQVSSDDRLWVLTALLFYFPPSCRQPNPRPTSCATCCGGTVTGATRGGRRRSCRQGAERAGLAWRSRLAGAVGWSAVTSVRLVAGMSQDTRAVAARWLDEKGELWKGERFTPAAEPMLSLPWSTLRPSGARHPLPGGKQLHVRDTLSGLQSGAVQRAAAALLRGYRRLFRYPYVEIRPAYRSFAFSNPVIRIVDLRGRPAPCLPRGDGPSCQLERRMTKRAISRAGRPALEQLRQPGQLRLELGQRAPRGVEAVEGDEGELAASASLPATCRAPRGRCGIEHVVRHLEREAEALTIAREAAPVGDTGQDRPDLDRRRIRQPVLRRWIARACPRVARRAAAGPVASRSSICRHHPE